MTKANHITISDACDKHGINRYTLKSWVKSKKVSSEKQKVGSQHVYFVDENSLLEQMKVSSATFTKPASDKEQVTEVDPEPQAVPSPPTAPTQAESAPQQVESEKQESNTKRREKPRSNQAVTRAKNSMRALGLDELVRINTWLANRISDKSLNQGGAS